MLRAGKPLFTLRPFPTRSVATILLLLAVASTSQPVRSQDGILLPGLSALSVSDTQDAAIAFVNMTSSPGLEGATLELEGEGRQSQQWRSSLGFTAEVTLKQPVFNAYWGLALVGASLHDEIDLIADNGQPVHLDLTRHVVGLRGSLGLVLPIDEHLKVKPFLSLVRSDLNSKSTIDNLSATGPSAAPSGEARYKTSSNLLSSVATIDASYWQWRGNNKVELAAQFNLINTNSVSGDTPWLNVSSWERSVQLKGKYSGPTSLVSVGRPWRWNAYATYTDFISTNKFSLGYNKLIEIGAGMDWQINIEPLDWFGWRSIGWSVGLIKGDNVVGYNIGVTAQ